MPKLQPYRGSYGPLHEMDRDHGIPIWDSEASLLRFRTGAVRRQTCGDPAYTMTAMPPADAKERQKLIVRFWKLYAKQAADEFVDMKNILVNSEQAIARVDEAEKELKDLQKVAREGKRELKKAEDEMLRLEMNVDSVEEAHALKAQRDREAGESYQREQARRDQARGRLASIRI